MREQPLTLTLQSNASPERLMAITRDLSRDLSRVGAPATLPLDTSSPGTRGDVATIGQIGLALITSGVVTALIECFKTYLARERSLVIKIAKPDGSLFEVNATNVDAAATQQVLAALSSK